ncbi:MAG: hypothetical protein ACLU22_11680 [Clostridium sp.]
MMWIIMWMTSGCANMGDYVSVVVPDEKITYEVINKGARDD